MDKDLAHTAAAQIWAILIPFDTPHTRMDGIKARDLKRALEDLAKGLEGADAQSLYDADRIRMALTGGLLAVPQKKPDRETIINCCESLMQRLKSSSN